MSFNLRTKTSGFTLTEVLIASGALAIFATALLTTWSALGTSVMNTTSYAQRQNDQMRVFDYLKRDIRRASSIIITSNGIAVAGSNFGDTITLTIPDYYTDARQEDNAIGANVAVTPTLSGSTVTYGATLTVKYYVLNGAIIRNEGGTLRTVGGSSGAFSVSFSNDPSGLIRCRVLFNQQLRSGTGDTLSRQVDILCGQRTQLES